MSASRTIDGLTEFPSSHSSFVFYRLARRRLRLFRCRAYSVSWLHYTRYTGCVWNIILCSLLVKCFRILQLHLMQLYTYILENNIIQYIDIIFKPGLRISWAPGHRTLSWHPFDFNYNLKKICLTKF